MLVEREQAIRAFVPRDYWEVRGDVHARGGAAAAGDVRHAGAWRRPATRRRRASARAALADAIVARDGAHGGRGRPPGRVVERRAAARRSREPPPLLFDLTSLQRTANRRFGLSARRARSRWRRRSTSATRC